MTKIIPIEIDLEEIESEPVQWVYKNKYGKEENVKWTPGTDDGETVEVTDGAGSTYIFIDDIPKLIKALQEAYKLAKPRQ